MRNKVAILGLAKLGYAGRLWYENGRREIIYVSRAMGWNTRDFTAILAVTSPRCVVRRNIRLALHWQTHGTLPAGTMRSIVSACERYRDSGEIRGPKVSAFYQALSGDDDCIVWDTHMFRAFADKDSFRQSEAKSAESILREVAVELDLTACQCQAAIWAGWRQLQGWNRSDYPVIEEWKSFYERADYVGS